MNKIEDLVCDKIFSLINYLISKAVKPDIQISDVKELTEEQIDDLRLLGIKGIILDLDETLRSNMQDIPSCNKAWLDMIKQKLKVIVVSNGFDKNAGSFLRLNGIDYMGLAYKPLKRCFKKACKQMDLKPEEILVVGDSLFSDIYGGKRNQMITALIEPKLSELEH